MRASIIQLATVLLGCNFVGLAIDVQRVPAKGSILQFPPWLRSHSGLLNTALDLRPLRLRGPDVDIVTRAINGSIPGPTLAVRPGDELMVRFANRLGLPLGPGPLNDYHFPNMSNLHVHGLHVSPLPPGDDVISTLLSPGDAWQYRYSIVSDHSPGTYWIHTHSHGSSVLQTGAGTASPLIVLDPVGFLSPQLAAMEDRVLMLQCLPRKLLEQAAIASHDRLFHIDRWGWGPELWLVNGAPEPVLQVQAGRWYRVRMIMAGVASWLHLDFGNCEVALLAKDGIYIDDFPRWISKVTLPPGGRVDVVMRCNSSVNGSDQHKVQSLPGLGGKAFVGDLFTIHVEGAGAKDDLLDQHLSPWSAPSRPAYLQDTRATAKPACACSTSMGLGGNTRWIEGHLWEGSHRYLHRSPEGAVVERWITGINKHPYHQHNYPFQIVNMTIGNITGDLEEDGGYFKVGDWHDTYFNPADSGLRARYNTMDFHGPMVVHCHNLAHSDKGMIGVEMVRGKGPSACGCDLLDMSERRPEFSLSDPTQLPETGPQVFLVAILLAFMLVLVIAGASWIVVTLRSDPAQCYASLDERL